jgi:hypothetical protein
VDAFIDSDPAVVENLKIETVFPITPYLVDRSRGDSLLELAKEIQRSS